VKSEVGFILPVTALLLEARAADTGFGPRGEKKNLPPPPTKGGQAKDLYTKSERLILNCRVTWALAERINWYSRQVMILLRNTTTYAS